jgi:hypothetical protein
VGVASAAMLFRMIAKTQQSEVWIARRGVTPAEAVSSVLRGIRLPMAKTRSFQQAGFLEHLERLTGSPALAADATLPPPLASMLMTSDGSAELTKAAGCLIPLLRAVQAMLQAASDTELAADELRRYQKYARPGQPSSHIVQLRQKQAAARQATNQSKQAFNKAAVAFVREAGIEVPPRVTLEAFITDWIDANVPKAFVSAT